MSLPLGYSYRYIYSQVFESRLLLRRDIEGGDSIIAPSFLTLTHKGVSRCCPFLGSSFPGFSFGVWRGKNRGSYLNPKPQKQLAKAGFLTAMKGKH